MPGQQPQSSEVYDLNKLKIASPCSASWEGMTGDDKQRFCASCELSVYNISEMTPKEASDLIRNAEGDRLCFRFFRRADGTIITQDCPVGLAARTSRFVKACAAGILSLLGFLPGCGAGAEKPVTGKTPVEQETPKGAQVLGEPIDVVIEEPVPLGLVEQGAIIVEELGDVDVGAQEPEEATTEPEPEIHERLGRVQLHELEPEIGKVKLEDPKKD